MLLRPSVDNICRFYLGRTLRTVITFVSGIAAPPQVWFEFRVPLFCYTYQAFFSINSFSCSCPFTCVSFKDLSYSLRTLGLHTRTLRWQCHVFNLSVCSSFAMDRCRFSDGGKAGHSGRFCHHLCLLFGAVPHCCTKLRYGSQLLLCQGGSCRLPLHSQLGACPVKVKK